MDMVATYNETILASNDPRKDLPAGFYTMKSLVFLKLTVINSYQQHRTTTNGLFGQFYAKIEFLR